MKRPPSTTLLKQLFAKQQYRGKQVVIIGDKVHILSTRSKKARAALLTSLAKKYPGQTPLISVIPKDNSLILIM